MALKEPVAEYDLAPASDPASRPFVPFGELRPLAPAKPRPAVSLTTLFVILGGGLVIGAILQQPDPSYCPNDASRWDTVYYLSQYGKYEFLPDHGAWWNTKKAGLFRDRLPFWTIDMVATKDDDGKYHYYSSKPPLLPTMAAGVVLGIEKTSDVVKPVLLPALKRVAGEKNPLAHACEPGSGKWGSTDPKAGDSWIDFRIHRWFVMRTTLILIQAIPFMVFVWLIARQFREGTDSPFALYFCTAVAALGTYLTPWSITFNNHVLGAFTALFATIAALRIWYDGRREWYWFASAGFFASLAATLELPAATLTGAVLLALLVKDWRRTLGFAVIPAVIPVAALLYTNFLALGTFWPAYSDFGKPGGLYEYPGSYWMPLPKDGMDGLQEPKRIYLMHLLVGHHGFFLLTPILVVALVGMGRHLRALGLACACLVSIILLGVAGALAADIATGGTITSMLEQSLARMRPEQPVHLPQGYSLLAPLAPLLLISLGMFLPAPAGPRPMFALVVLLMSATVIGFYTMTTNNYGGLAQGARWLFWLVPFWLLMLPAGVEWMARRRLGRAVCCSLLLVSMITVAFAFRQPWSDSWAHVLFRNVGWIRY